MYRGRFGIIAGARRGLASLETATAKLLGQELKLGYARHVASLKALMPHDKAMELAVGGSFSEQGPIQVALMRHYGLAAEGSVVDIGCGSGRLANPLSAFLKGPYLGIDPVPDLIAYARRNTARADWRFEVIRGIGIPAPDASVDMVVAFSVFTHLLHEESFWYLEEARRALKPGGRVMFSFLEFKEPHHREVFDATLALTKVQGRESLLNVFMDRDWIPIWADWLGLAVIDVRPGLDQIVPEGVLGQSVCVLEKPA